MILLFAYLFKYFVSHTMIISQNDSFLYYLISIKSNFLVLHDFTKCFSGIRANQIVNECLNGSLYCLISLLILAP